MSTNRQARTQKLHVYVTGNLDGVNAAIVAAPSLKAAARALGTTVGEINRNGGRKDDHPKAAACLAEPLTPFYREIARFDNNWTREPAPRWRR